MIKPLFANGNGESGGESNSLSAELPYSATSLVDHRVILQQGDAVSSLLSFSCALDTRTVLREVFTCCIILRINELCIVAKINEFIKVQPG